MAKAEELTGIDCEMDAAQAAAIVLRTRFQEMRDFRDATLDFTTIDGVHNMRVAMRRMRNGVRDMRHVLVRDHYKPFIKKLKKMYDVVGCVRDEDVAIASLGEMRANADSEIVKQGIDNLLHDHNGVRDAARDKLTDVLAGERFDELERDFEALILAVIEEGGEKKATFREVGRKTILDIVGKFSQLSENLDTPYDFEALHKFRIASKRLRTSLQLFSCCWEAEVEPFIKDVAKMQLLLGKVHDRDGWLTDLTSRVDASNEKVLIMDGLAVKWISAQLVQKRNKNYRAAVDLWKEWEANNFIENLKNLVAK